MFIKRNLKNEQKDVKRDGKTDSMVTKRPYILKMLLYLCIMAFFVCVVFIYYRRLYDETMERIISKGRLSAEESAFYIEKRLSSAEQTLLLAAYTINGMMKKGSSNDEIFDYMSKQTESIRETLYEDSTGFYGFIDGEFLDGSGWIAPEDYDATERPWYVQGREGNGEIVFVTPYDDQNTGKKMMALSITLSDGESVLGTDISIDDLKKDIDKVVDESDLFASFLMNDEGDIIVHSKMQYSHDNIYETENRIHKAVAEIIKESGKGYYFDRGENGARLIYVRCIDNDWYIVSLLNATDDYYELNKPLIFSLMVIASIVVLYLFAMWHIEKRERRLRNADLKTRKAVADNDAKTAFLSGMSHEIRTPINTILGMNEMILRESESDSITGYSENIKGAGNYLLGIINNVLDYAKIEKGELVIEPVDYDICELIDDIANVFYKKTDDKGLIFKMELDHKIPKRLKGDRIKLKEIITHLMDNAVKYTEKGTVTLRIYGKNFEGDDKIRITFEISDTGIGIRKEDQDKIFTGFEKLENNNNRSKEGAGLGLSIAKRILEIMGSKLEVNSEPGAGSTFRFSILQVVRGQEPIGEYKAPYTAGIKEKTKNTEFIAPNARILAVDDNPMNLMVFQSLVKHMLLDVDTAESGDECLRLSRIKKYDMIFMDHMMPGKDGIETVKEMRDEKGNPNVDTPVVCLTANAIAGVRERYIEAGFIEYLTKPVSPERLEETLFNNLPESLLQEAGGVMTREDKDAELIAEIEQKMANIPKDMIDSKTGIRNSGSPESYISLLKVFYNTITDKVDELNSYIENGDYETYTIKVHALKSSARIIGAGGLGEEAQILENAGKRGDVDFILAHHKEFLDRLISFKEPLSLAFPKEEKDDIDKPEADAELMKIVYEEIKAAADDMNCDRLEEIFEKMEEYRIPDSEKDVFEKIRSASDSYDYDKIVEYLSGLL